MPHERDAPYASPYLTGVGIGIVLLVAYVVMGHGLGVSGALTSVVGTAAAGVSETAAASNAWSGYAANGFGALLRDWFVIEVVGIAIGGLVSAALAGRLRRETERGASVAPGRRVMFALGGGAIMGIGARLAKGCTSGQALTGGSLLSVGSWIFIAAAFAAAYLVVPLVRREWR
jgi:uncharacterized membrane protein YedE/YeeE